MFTLLELICFSHYRIHYRVDGVDIKDTATKQRWKPVGSTCTGLVEIFRPAGQAGQKTGQTLLSCN